MVSAVARSQRQDTNPGAPHRAAHAGLPRRLLPHLYALPVRICAPHVPQDGIHGTAVVKLLFKLVRVT